MNTEDQITRALRGVTEETDYPTTPVTTVAARARVVRARRRRTTILAAAATVAAISVPGAVWLNRSPGASPAPSHELSSGPTTAPSQGDGRQATLDSLPAGPKPGVDYLLDDTYVTTVGERITAPVLANATSATPSRGGILATVPGTPGLMQQEGIAGTYLVTNGHGQYLGCGSDRFAMSTDGTQSAYWLSDACPVTGSSTGKLFSGVTNTMGEGGPGYAATPAGETVAPVGILREGTVVNAPAAQLVDPGGQAHDLASLSTAGGSDENNDVVSGQLSSDRTTGAVVQAATGTVLWRAPGWRLGQFSVDGRYVLGVQPADGFPDAYAVFDAASGQRMTSFSGGSLAVRFADTPLWDNDDTLLAAATGDGTSAIVRVDLEGRLTRATPVVDVSDGHPGYRLATRP